MLEEASPKSVRGQPISGRQLFLLLLGRHQLVPSQTTVLRTLFTLYSNSGGQGSEWSAEDWLGLARPRKVESSLKVEIRLAGRS